MIEWDFGWLVTYWPALVSGLRETIVLTLVSFVVSVLIGVVACALRAAPWRILSIPGLVFIEFMRATPLLVQILWVYYSLSLLVGLTLTAFQAGVLALGANVGAFIAEILRSGIRSVPAGQQDAARALGMNSVQMATRVVIPQALRAVIPPLGSMWVGLFKDTALVSIIGVPELLAQAQDINAATFRPVEVFTIVGIIYLVLGYSQARLVDRLYRKADSSSTAKVPRRKVLR